MTTRRRDIQGLRAIAVLVVVAFHAGLPVPGGFVGVDVFFVISGYVIAAMLQREWMATGRIAFARFYVRRFKRLTPALALTVLVTMMISAFVLSPLGPQQAAARTGLGALFLASNAVIATITGGYFDAPAEGNPLLNMWSLSVEEQFYLLFPLLLVIGWRRRRVVTTVTLVTCASFVAAMLGTRGYGGDWLGFYSPLTRAWEFGVGALLALRGVHLRSRSAALAGILGIAALMASLWLIDARTPFPGVWTLLPVIATAALIASGTSEHRISRWLSSAPMTKLGDWSYSIYLWHWPAIVLAGIAFPDVEGIAIYAAIGSLVPALVSYRFVEEPIRNRDFTRPQLSRVVVVALLPPVAASLAVIVVANLLLTPRLEQVFVQASVQHAGYAEGCHFEPESGNADPEPCVWNDGAGGAPVYLLGDSNAAQYVEALIGATRQPARPLVVTTSSGCPVTDVVLEQVNHPGYDERCAARNARLLQWMDAQPVGTVMLAWSNEFWLTSAAGVRADGVWVRDPSAKTALFEASLTRTVERLQAAGHHVVLVRGIPHFVDAYEWNLAKCSLTELNSGCVQSLPLDWALQRAMAVDAAVSRVVDATAATLLDVIPDICPDGVCSTWRGDLPVFRDGTHITVAMSEQLAPRFAAVL